MANVVELVKKAAVGAVEASKPVNLLFGKVVSDDPLQIEIDQKLTYPAAFLILSRNVTDYEVDVEVAFNTEQELEHIHVFTDSNGITGKTLPTNHAHEVKATKKLKIKNGLKVDDVVVMMRLQGGKRFLVLDRLQPNPDLEGEWIDEEEGGESSEGGSE